MPSRREFLSMLGIVAAVPMADLIGPVHRIETAPRAAPLAAGDPSTVLARLLGQLTDRNPRIRAEAIETLGRADDLEAVDALGRAVTQGDRQEAGGYALAWVAGAR